MAERSKAVVSKTTVTKVPRGFESYFLCHIINRSMSIINKHGSAYLGPNSTTTIKPTTPAAGFTLHSFYNFSDKSYWHVSCFDGASLRQLKYLLPVDVLQEIRQKNVTLSIGAEYEGFIDIPEVIYDLIVELSIPAESVLLFSPNANIAQVVDKIALKRSLPKIQTKWVCVFERIVSSVISMPLNTLEIKEYPKKFLSLNRRWRGCKLTLISHLRIRNLLDRGFVSLQSFEGKTWENSWDYMKQLQDDTTKQLFEQHKDVITGLPDLILDNLDPDDMNPVTNTLDEYYLNSYFSVVGGAIFYEKEMPNVAGICEKPFKAIQKKHPFILMSTANNLPLLHRMGYKTFDGLIDESYDHEIDDNKRMRMIVDEIERLCNLNDAELRTFLIEAKKIVDHNFRNMYERMCLPRV